MASSSSRPPTWPVSSPLPTPAPAASSRRSRAASARASRSPPPPCRAPRYLTPLVPLLALLVAHPLLATTGRARPLVVGVLACALLAEPVLSAIAYDRIVARTDTRVLATHWMAAHLPAGAVVAV